MSLPWVYCIYIDRYRYFDYIHCLCVINFNIGLGTHLARSSIRYSADDANFSLDGRIVYAMSIELRNMMRASRRGTCINACIDTCINACINICINVCIYYDHNDQAKMLLMGVYIYP